MELSLKDLRELIGGCQSSPSCSFRVGVSYLIRSVTFYYTGRVKDITDSDIVLEQAAWIADTGRFHDALKSGEFNEVEPFCADVIIPRGSIVDATEWTNDLPKEQK